MTKQAEEVAKEAKRKQEDSPSQAPEEYVIDPRTIVESASSTHDTSTRDDAEDTVPRSLHESMMAAFAAEHSVSLARHLARLKEEHMAEVQELQRRCKAAAEGSGYSSGGKQGARSSIGRATTATSPLGFDSPPLGPTSFISSEGRPYGEEALTVENARLRAENTWLQDAADRDARTADEQAQLARQLQHANERMTSEMQRQQIVIDALRQECLGSTSLPIQNVDQSSQMEQERAMYKARIRELTEEGRNLVRALTLEREGRPPRSDFSPTGVINKAERSPGRSVSAERDASIASTKAALLRINSLTRDSQFV